MSHQELGAEIFWELFFFILGINFFSMVSIGGGDVSGGGGLSLQRRVGLPDAFGEHAA